MARTFAQVAIIALVGSTLASAAGAQGVQEVRGQSVARIAYSDLNLASASGRQQLARRVSTAAHALCGPAPSRLNLAATNRHRGCVDGVIASSVPSQDEAAARQSAFRAQVMASRK